MWRTINSFVVLAVFTLFTPGFVLAQQAQETRTLIHMKTSLALDDARICAVPTVVWTVVKAGHTVTILVDVSAVTSVTRDSVSSGD